uniref:Uncharacterized protein n=1 Tax=Timspurckia oligopyrenoides TaxID=708627 RepID=A0A7S0ZD97_9RHOD
MSSLEPRDIIDLVDVLTDQSMSVHIQRVDASLQLFAQLVTTRCPIAPRTVVALLEELESAGTLRRRSITGGLYDFIFSQGQALRRRLGDAFPSTGFVSSVKVSPFVKESPIDADGFQSLYLHIVLASCFDYFDALCVCGSFGSSTGFRTLASKLDALVEHAALCVRCLKAACLPEANVDHREFVSFALGDMFSTCLAMQEHLDARVRLVGFEVFTAGVEVLLLSSKMRVSVIGNVHGNAGIPDAEAVLIPLPRGRSKFVHDPTQSVHYEDKGWNLLSMFVLSSLNLDSPVDLDLQYAAVRYVRTALLRAITGLCGSGSVGALNFEHIVQLWDSVAPLDVSAWRELSLQSNIVLMILVNAALYVVFSARGPSQLNSRISALQNFTESKVFPWFESRLKGENRQMRFWAARIVECYLRGCDFNKHRPGGNRIPQLSARVWRAMRALRTDWYTDLAVFSESLKDFYRKPDKPVDESVQRSSSRLLPSPLKRESVQTFEPHDAVIELWFPDVTEDSLAEIIEDENQYSLTFSQYVDMFITGEDDVVVQEEGYLLVDDSVLPTPPLDENQSNEMFQDAVVEVSYESADAHLDADTLSETTEYTEYSEYSESNVSEEDLQDGLSGDDGENAEYRRNDDEVEQQNEYVEVESNEVIGFGVGEEEIQRDEVAFVPDVDYDLPEEFQSTEPNEEGHFDALEDAHHPVAGLDTEFAEPPEYPEMEFSPEANSRIEEELSVSQVESPEVGADANIDEVEVSVISGEVAHGLDTRKPPISIEISSEEAMLDGFDDEISETNSQSVPDAS